MLSIILKIIWEDTLYGKLPIIEIFFFFIKSSKENFKKSMFNIFFLSLGNFSFKRGNKSLSISIKYKFEYFLTKYCVRIPFPGPISIIKSFLSLLRELTILSAIFKSFRKC